jgi:hypothetical protein
VWISHFVLVTLHLSSNQLKTNKTSNYQKLCEK